MKKKYFGKMINVNNHNIHIYSEGNSLPALVFMSGSATYYPVNDFSKLFKKMSNEYKIAVVERAGYGFSEISNSSRDIDTILFETRTVLKERGINPPYILIPHSMAGIEAFYWIQNYPEEIKAIIGIDIGLPTFYEKIKLDNTIKIAKIISKIFYKRITKDMINEGIMVKENAQKINKDKLKNTPLLLFVSNGKQTGYKKDEWKKLFIDYTKELNAKIISLNGGHYLHNIFTEEITNISKTFIKEILK
jgi:hypothetical protein